MGGKELNNSIRIFRVSELPRAGRPLRVKIYTSVLHFVVIRVASVQPSSQALSVSLSSRRETTKREEKERGPGNEVSKFQTFVRSP